MPEETKASAGSPVGMKEKVSTMLSKTGFKKPKNRL